MYILGIVRVKVGGRALDLFVKLAKYGGSVKAFICNSLLSRRALEVQSLPLGPGPLFDNVCIWRTRMLHQLVLCQPRYKLP